MEIIEKEKEGTYMSCDPLDMLGRQQGSSMAE